MDDFEIAGAFDTLFDEAMVSHGFTDDMRDYEVVVLSDDHYNQRYVFRYCVEAHVVTTLRPDTWRLAFEDEGFAWDVKFETLYPGASLVPNSARAAHWEQAVGMPFREAKIETNVHRLELVFHDLELSEV